VSATRVVRLGIRVRRDRAEIALANLLPLLAAGAEERDLGGMVEYALYLPERELPPPQAIRVLAGEALLGTVTEPVPEDWERRHLAHLRRVSVDGLSIRPPWLAGEPDDLVIDPATTFGAGTHESTRLALGLLMAAEPGGALCDWGAGSGVLAVAAARLGWAPVTAVELDGRAAAVIVANAAANGVEVSTRRADLRHDPLPWAPTVAANLSAELHRGVAARLDRPPERLIASGFLAREAHDVAGRYAPLREVARRSEGEWAAMVLA
jgi:ribosomal protein L11 methyltransferase